MIYFVNVFNLIAKNIFMPFKKYIYDLENLEKKQQNTYALTIIILSILSIVRDSIYNEYHSIIIYILLLHIYIIQCR